MNALPRFSHLLWRATPARIPHERVASPVRLCQGCGRRRDVRKSGKLYWPLRLIDLDFLIRHSSPTPQSELLGASVIFVANSPRLLTLEYRILMCCGCSETSGISVY